MAEQDDPLAATARALNEERKSRSRKGPVDDGGEAGDVAGAVAGLGAAVDANAPPEEKTDHSEAAHEKAIEQMEAIATDAVITDKHLIAFGRDFMLDQIKSRPKVWGQTPEDQKRDVAAACEHASTEFIRKIVEALATGGKQTVRVLLTKVTLGDDIVIAGKVKTFAEDEEDAAVVMLHGARGKHVMLTVASADDYRGGDQADIELDEPPLDFERSRDPDDD